MPVSVFHVYRALLFIMFLFTIAYIVALAILAPDNTIFFIAALGLDLMILGYLIWLDFYNAWKGRIRIIRSNLGALAIDIGSNIAFTAFIPFLSSLEAIMERMTIGYWVLLVVPMIIQTSMLVYVWMNYKRSQQDIENQLGVFTATPPGQQFK